ncbi:hypothetical protein CLF_104996 [Clonorchis sinensis]|uniref:Uncharacterized protein n=1 Tax=Clonorchis sinensis TaxID=79923 RepID=G7YP18_CLOSI|nr:hypothetical protein CLF_104996 [Clonorchis sinensis]
MLPRCLVHPLNQQKSFSIKSNSVKVTRKEATKASKVLVAQELDKKSRVLNLRLKDETSTFQKKRKDTIVRSNQPTMLLNLKGSHVIGTESEFNSFTGLATEQRTLERDLSVFVHQFTFTEFSDLSKSNKTESIMDTFRPKILKYTVFLSDEDFFVFKTERVGLYAVSPKHAYNTPIRSYTSSPLGKNQMFHISLFVYLVTWLPDAIDSVIHAHALIVCLVARGEVEEWTTCHRSEEMRYGKLRFLRNFQAAALSPTNNVVRQKYIDAANGKPFHFDGRYRQQTQWLRRTN